MKPGVVIELPNLPRRTLVHRRPGRPWKVETAPTVDERAYTALVATARRAHVEGDGLVALGSDAATDDVLDAVIIRVAEEAAGLAFGAQRAEGEGRDATMIRGRRIKALLQLAGLLRERELLRRERGGLSEDDVPVVKGDFRQRVREVVEATLPPEKATEFLFKFETKLGA